MRGLHLLKKYQWDLFIVAAAACCAASLGVFAHGLLKPFSAQIAMAAPLVFTIAVLALLTVICTSPRSKLGKWLMRICVDLAVMGLLVPMAFLKIESLVAPYAWYLGAKPDQVVAWIASDQDLPRLAAWSRLLSMPRADKEVVAKALAKMLVGSSDHARRSAELTLNVPLRQFSLTALTVLTADLKTYLAARAQTQAAPSEAQRAGAFAAEFVGKNVGSIHKALDRDKRDLLPAGGLEALFLALATEPTIGPIYLRELALHGDATQKPLAESVLQLAAIGAATGEGQLNKSL